MMKKAEKIAAADRVAKRMRRTVVTYANPKKCTDHNRLVVTLDDGSMGFMLHETMIVHVSEDGHTIMFDNGGWFSPTTKTAMNQALREFGLFYHGPVHQTKGEWFAFGQKFTDDGKLVLEEFTAIEKE